MKIQELTAPSGHYPELLVSEALQHTPDNEQVLTPDQSLQTAENYLETEDFSRMLQQALALDFDKYASSLPQEELDAQAAPFIVQLNEQRTDPINPTTLERRVKEHLIRPKWHEHFPVDTSEESEKAWTQFKRQYPEHIQENIEELRVVDNELKAYFGNTELMQEVSEIRAERIEVMRAASIYTTSERKLAVITKQETTLWQIAAASNRSLTRAEEAKLERLQQHALVIKQRQEGAVTSSEIVKEIEKRRAIADMRQLERGLLMTEPMQHIIDDVLPSLVAGKPVLFVGETGGAKTALAEYISRSYFKKEPEIISGYGDVNSYQVMGKMQLSEQNGASISEFVPGPMVKAMEEGRPLILDEINAMPAEFLKRLNKIMQLKPGDTFVVQEDSGRQVTLQPGFCIIATANEKSKRYKGVEDLSVEFQNRFGANVIRVRYPDYDVPDDQPPKDNLRLALALLRNRNGEIDKSLLKGIHGTTEDTIEKTALYRFVQAARITQKVFSTVADSSMTKWGVDADAIRDRKPGLEESVIAPRTMVDILTKVKNSHGKLSINQALATFVDGIKNPKDRKQIIFIVKAHGFLEEPAPVTAS